MKRNYAYLLCIFIFFAIKTVCLAENAMNVMSKENKISSTQLEKLKQVTFNDSQIQIHLIDGSVVTHEFTEFDNIIFGEYVPIISLDELIFENTEFNVYLSEEKTLRVESSTTINSLNLIDLYGHTIKVSLSGNESNVVNVSVKSLTTGLYIILAETENGVKTSKIIIK